MPPQPTTVEIVRSAWQHRIVHYRKGYLILKVFNPSGLDDDTVKTIDSVVDQQNVTYEIEARINRWAYLRIIDMHDMTIPDLADALTALHEVEFAEPDLAMKIAVDPEDPLLSPGHEIGAFEVHQWAIEHLNMYLAWEMETGKDTVLIGLVDSGIPVDDEDLTHQGYVENHINHEDLDGKRFIAGNSYLWTEPTPKINDIAGHGTNMAGIIAATPGNDKGLAGMNWVSPVYICQVFTKDQIPTAGPVYLAIKEIIAYAEETDRNAVINLSVNYEDDMGGLDYGTLDDLVTAAGSERVILVCAVGNGPVDVEYPATLASQYKDRIVAVSATREDDGIYENANYDKSSTIPDADGDYAVTVVAPGDDIGTTDVKDLYAEHGGTSEATAHVTGLISLMWSKNKEMTAAQIIACLKNTSKIPQEIPGPDPDPDVGTDWGRKYGSGLIDPVAALERSAWEVTLETPEIAFVNVPEGEEPCEVIRLLVTGCADVSFTVEVSGDDFGVVPGTYDHLVEDGEVFERLVAKYSETLPDEASATITIRWDQKPDQDPFVVYITANRIPTQKSVLLLTADQSGSMDSDSGINGYSRMDVLKYSSNILIGLIEEKSAMGIVSFDEKAHHVSDVTVIDPSDPDDARDTLKSGIEGLAAGGWTSIGAGIQRAGEYLNGVPPELLTGDETRAVVVLTDGKENREPYLDEILAAGFPYPVYAIGMGTPDALGVEAMTALSEATNGYTVITGNLDDDSEYLVASFFDKILAEINGDDVVLDPVHRLLPNRIQEYQIKVTRADKRLDVIVMRPAKASPEVIFLTPENHKIPGDSALVSALHETRVSRYRLPLPAMGSLLHTSHAGIWRVRLSIRKNAFGKLLNEIEHEGKNKLVMRTHGFRYALHAHVRSSLRMRARVYQGDFAPGSLLTLRAVISQNGLPLVDPVTSVGAVVTQPDGLVTTLKCDRKHPAVFEADYQAKIPGVYFFKVVAEGLTTNGDKYRREALLTGAIRRSGLGWRSGDSLRVR